MSLERQVAASQLPERAPRQSQPEEITQSPGPANNTRAIHNLMPAGRQQLRGGDKSIGKVYIINRRPGDIILQTTARWEPAHASRSQAGNKRESEKIAQKGLRTDWRGALESQQSPGSSSTALIWGAGGCTVPSGGWGGRRRRPIVSAY